MEALPARELLEAVHEFPCAFIFKAVGPAGGEFVASVVAEVWATLSHDFDSPYETRERSARFCHHFPLGRNIGRSSAGLCSHP